MVQRGRQGLSGAGRGVCTHETATNWAGMSEMLLYTVNANVASALFDADFAPAVRSAGSSWRSLPGERRATAEARE